MLYLVPLWYIRVPVSGHGILYKKYRYRTLFLAKLTDGYFFSYNIITYILYK
jgi:hypothetical protein